MEKEAPESKRTWEKIKAANAIGMTIVVFCLLLVILLIFFDIPSGNKEIFITIISFVFGSGFSGVVYYFFDFRHEKSPATTNTIENYNDTCERCGQSFFNPVRDEL